MRSNAREEKTTQRLSRYRHKLRKRVATARRWERSKLRSVRQCEPKAPLRVVAAGE